MSPAQLSLFSTLAELYGTDVDAVVLALACDRLESAPARSSEDAMPLLLWEYAGAQTVPQVHPAWDFKGEAAAAVPESA